MISMHTVRKARRNLEEYLSSYDEQEFSSAHIAKQLKRINRHDDKEFLDYIRRIPNEYLGDIFIELPDHMLKDIIESVSSDKIADVIEELESDDATDLIQDIEDIDEEKAKEVFDNLDKKDQEEIARLIVYDENKAGAYMQAESFVAKMDETIKDSIIRLRHLKEEGELENIHQLFILSPTNVLLYGISLEDLITFDFDLTYQEVIRKEEDGFYDPITAYDDDDISRVISLFDDHDLSVLPIINDDGKLVGRITGDDIHEIIQESATEQIYNLAGVDDEAEEEATLYEVGKSRAVWLSLNLVTAILSATIISLFDETIQAFVALAVLMPIVASMGGNVGMQTLTVVVRKLALGEIDFGNEKEALLKELIVSIVNGLIFAFAMALVAYFWFDKMLLGAVIAMAMIINFFMAGFFGVIIPLTLKHFNVDPAVGSSVLLTTITDMVGFFTFLGLASWILI